MTLLKKYGADGGSFWRWTSFLNSEDTDATLATPIKLRGVAFNYTPVKTTLVQALCAIAAAKNVVSNDSGLMHVAAAFGVPQVAIFGSSSPLHTPPLSEQATVLWLKADPAYQPPC